MRSSCFRIGLFAIGLDTYWNQFEGLKSRLEGYLSTIHQNMALIHPEIVDAGMVDHIDKAFETGRLFRQSEVDLIFLFASTYALSSTILPVVQRAKVPVIILNLSPSASIDYESFNSLKDRTKMTGEWLAHCNACPVPEIANLFKRTGIRFYQVTGMLEEERVWVAIREWIEAASVANTMFHNRMACLGHYYSGMLDIYSDLTLHLKYFGGHFELIELDELSALRKEVSLSDVNRRVQYFKEVFDVQEDCSETALIASAQTSLALDKLMEKYRIGSMAYYYKGTGILENEETIDSIILGNSLLTANGIPVAGEYEIKNAQAMKILDSFGAGGSFSEYYAMDFVEDVVLMGHDGPGHIAIAEGKIKVKPLKEYHGKTGSGLSVEMSIKHGKVTLLSVVEAENKLLLLVAEGESVPGPVLEIGNTNSRYKFSLGARQFVEAWNAQGPAHHCAIGTGHIASKIAKLGQLLNMEVIRIC